VRISVQDRSGPCVYAVSRIAASRISKKQLLFVCDFLGVESLQILFQVISLVYTLYSKFQLGDAAKIEGICRRSVYLRHTCCAVSK
jgi:hypothetical protein